VTSLQRNFLFTRRREEREKEQRNMGWSPAAIAIESFLRDFAPSREILLLKKERRPAAPSSI
jgi:hypothetical protein